MIKRTIKKLIPQNLLKLWREIKIRYFDGYALKSYAQDGEDIVLKEFLKGQQKGFYVDVGAHHPKRFSNTYFFYKRGWQGINIDAAPGSMQAFLRSRPNDINIEAAISDVQHELEFYIFNEPALNSFDEILSHQREEENPKYQIVKTKKMMTQRLETVLRDNLPSGQQIDFLSVDVEGWDLVVLRSNNWQIFRPKYILIETMTILDDVFNDSVYQFLTGKNYVLVAKTLRTAIFKDRMSDE